MPFAPVPLPMRSAAAVTSVGVCMTARAYTWYLFVHHCAHHGPDKLPLSLLKHHQSHHRFATRNYGVSTTLWDHVFGTMLH
jgi:sterol desaturase/sphingolipid hydroxylase (fatty acid hydroxylase superfamily)